MIQSLTSINDPIRLRVALNAAIAADGRARQVYGFRLGSCQYLASDNFGFSARGNAQLTLTLELRLNPVLEFSGQRLTLRPVMSLQGTLSRQKIRVDVQDSLLRSVLEDLLEDEIDDALNDSEVIRMVERLEQNLASALAGKLEDGLADTQAATTTWYGDPVCQLPVDYQPTSTVDYCNSVLDTRRLGNAASNVDELQRWTLSPGTRFDIGAAALEGKPQPFTQRVLYKSVDTDMGECALEMRIHAPCRCVSASTASQCVCAMH